MALTSTLAIFSPLFVSTAATFAAAKPTPYEAMEAFNLPIGILPKGAIGYDLDRNTGKFNAYLSGSCSFSLEGRYQLKYKSTISGYVTKNKLTNLSGVSIKILFLWINIVEVRRSADELEFSIGIASANLPIDNLYECPQCGRDLDCNEVGKMKTKTRSYRGLVSSI